MSSRSDYETITFAITKVVGHVILTPDGNGPSPYVAAMQLIAESGDEGTFTFPNPNGDGFLTSVTVNFNSSLTKVE